MVLLRSITSLSSHKNTPGTSLVGFQAVAEELTINGGIGFATSTTNAI